MLKVGDIYYLCDQYGPKFVKIITIGDIRTKDDNWVFFYKSTYLHNIINASFPEDDRGCDKAQVKKWHFEKLIDKITYNGNFKGCIKISDEIIQSIKENESVIINLIDHNPNLYPYMQIVGHTDVITRAPKVACKIISKQDFRNLKLDKILE